MTAPDSPLVVQLHQLLLRLAGWAPDQTVRQARELLAGGQIDDVGRLLVTVVATAGVPLRPDDAGLLARTMPDLPETLAVLGARELDENERPDYEFLPVLPEPLGSAPPPMLADLTAGALDEDGSTAVAALARVDAPVALWRAWRLPRPAEQDGRPVPVYVLETAGDAAALPDATARLQEALPGAQIEAYGPGVDPAPYQRQARGRSALLWAAVEAGPVTVARVFDSFNPETGGQFDPDHPLLTDRDDVARVLGYLDQGHVLLATTMREQDVYDAEAGAVVPASFRTDGRFVWTDAVAYYLRTYALSPDLELLTRIRELDFALPAVDAVAEHRTLAALMA